MSKTIIFASHSYSAKTNIINPLVQFFKENNFKIVFIHINSISGKSDTSEDLGYEHYDLSITDPRTIVNLFVNRKPCMLLCLEFTSLFIILLIRIAKLSRIKVLYVEHGIYIKGHADKFLVKSLKESVVRYVKVLKVYFRVGAIAKMSPVDEMKTIYKTFKNRDYSGLFDYGLFYAERGYDVVKDRFLLPLSKTHFAGYPIVSLNSEVEQLKNNHNKDGKTVLYIHQPLIQDKLVTISFEEEIAMFYELNDTCNKASLKLVIKLHPRSDIEFYKSLDTANKLTFSVDSFGALLTETKIIIGQFSTALFNGWILNIPVVVLPYKSLTSNYYENFIDFSFLLEDAKDFGKLIDEINNLNSLYDKEKMISYFCGKINTFENQADKIFEIAEIED